MEILPPNPLGFVYKVLIRKKILIHSIFFRIGASGSGCWLFITLSLVFLSENVLRRYLKEWSVSILVFLVF